MLYWPTQLFIISIAASAQAKSGCQWTRDEVQLLIKGVTTYPAGTARRYVRVFSVLGIFYLFRWEVIAQFVNQHSADDSEEKSSAQVIEKVKSLRKLGM